MATKKAGGSSRNERGGNQQGSGNALKSVLKYNLDSNFEMLEDKHTDVKVHFQRFEDMCFTPQGKILFPNHFDQIADQGNP